MNIPIITFNAGELSPQCDARSDVEKYGSGCRHLENMIPLIYGGVERRPGTKFISRKMPSYDEIIDLVLFYENDVLSYENETLFSKRVNVDIVSSVFQSMLFWENELLTYEGEILTCDDFICHNVDMLSYENSILGYGNNIITIEE